MDAMSDPQTLADNPRRVAMQLNGSSTIEELLV
jgi:hypothetical protein